MLRAFTFTIAFAAAIVSTSSVLALTLDDPGQRDCVAASGGHVAVTLGYCLQMTATQPLDLALGGGDCVGSNGSGSVSVTVGNCASIRW